MMMGSPVDRQQRLADNVAGVRQQMAAAAARGGRAGDDVLLVAVTKYVGAEIARWLPEAGCLALGESRPQSLWQKADAMGDLPVEWHLIGHLQRNKIRRTLPVTTWIHSVDSLRLMHALDEEARCSNRRIRVLIEVNVSGDAAKSGFSPAAASELVPTLGGWQHLEVCGLMAMSARLSDARDARRDFARLRQLRDSMQEQSPPEVRLDHLSMGMSRDFTVAIEEGATMVRIGSALFAGVLE